MIPTPDEALDGLAELGDQRMFTKPFVLVTELGQVSLTSCGGWDQDGSLGRPSTRSPTMLRWIRLVPPQIVSLRLKKNALDHRADRVAGAPLVADRTGPRARGRAGVDEHRRGAEDVERELHRLLVHLAPEHLVGRTQRGDARILRAGQSGRQRSQPVDAQQIWIFV